jgi:hypothetical protein
MPPRLYATLVVVCLACGSAAFPQAEESITAEWVPFVAKWAQTNDIESVQGHYAAKASGIFVRDNRGSWFRRLTTNSVRGNSPIIGYTDAAFLCDRVNHKAYLLDFSSKTITPMQMSDRDQPLSSRDFEFQHSLDKFLGKQIVSGVECEGYALHGSRHNGRYTTEEWYAPSLNYLVVESKVHIQGDQEVEARVEEIQVGKEPDPQYFSLPKGFKMIK